MVFLPQIKRGDTLIINLEFTDSEGAPLIVSPSELKAQIRTKEDGLVTEFDIAAAEIEGTYILTLPEGENLDVGEYYTDIQYTSGGVISSTETLLISILKDVTQ